VSIPLALIAAAGFWQVLPRKIQIRCQAWRFVFMLVVIPIGIWTASLIGPVFERAFFSVRILDETVAQQMVNELGEANVDYTDAGELVVYDLRTWLSAHRQDPQRPAFASKATGGWMILLTPLALLLGGYFTTRYVNPLLLAKKGAMRRQSFAWYNLGKFVICTFLSLLMAWFFSWILGVVWDPRGSYVDQYVQRNALVVGFIMGFAVIPIIYTIADDALSAVPEHLRSASLGAGATRWQTAIRIIIPTAMSGLFSAIMVGFGRAVGETMIVLMAAGNTPIMEWNIFNGFRTLSANIAVEMMEAVEGSTNYRTLFLTAVILFIITFIINTIAEKVRQHYRKRAYEL
jgi:phosphate transport system permease protein